MKKWKIGWVMEDGIWGLCNKSWYVQLNWIAWYMNSNHAYNGKLDNRTYFNSFGVEHISKEIKIMNKNIKINIYRIQAYDSLMCWFFCTGFIDVVFKGENRFY